MYKMSNYSQCMQYRSAPESVQAHDKKIETNMQEPRVSAEIKNWFDDFSVLVEPRFHHDKIESIPTWQIIREKYTIEVKLTISNKDKSAEPDDVANNKVAFKKFVKNNLHNPEFSNKYVIFAYGNFQDVGNDEFELVDKIYKKFGNIDMYVGRVSQKIQIEKIESTELG